MSLLAYQRTRTITETPRSTEHRLMSQITAAMIDARDRGATGGALAPVLHRNREMWGVLSACCAAPGNQLPDRLRGQIISLALWVDRFTSSVIAGSERIDQLIGVNLAVIEGLA